MSDPQVLSVFLHSHLVGTLTLLPGDQTLFAFSDAYIRKGGHPTLSLSFQDELGELITKVQATQTRVPPFFANLLPEGPLREYLAGRAGVHPDREFFLLGVLGRDLPGAITIGTADEDSRLPPTATGSGVEASAAPTGTMRFSLAGVQLKFSAIEAAAGGLTIPASGADGDWIVKLPSAAHAAVPINEFAMMRLARRVGIEVPEIKLVPLRNIGGLPIEAGHNDDEAFAIKRFDRTGSGVKTHIEDFAQVFGVCPRDKYKKGNFRNIAEVIQAEAGAEAIAEFIRRLVFSALIGNADMHLKNWSLLYGEDDTVSLSPAYDLVSTVPYPVKRGLGLNLYKSATKTTRDLNVDGLRKLAGGARLSEHLVLGTARDMVEAFVDAWTTGDERRDLPAFIARAIDEHYPEVPLLRDFGISA